MVHCACNCGTLIRAVDSQRHRRRYAKGHSGSRRSGLAQEQFLAFLQGQPAEALVSIDEIEAGTDLPRNTVWYLAASLSAKGILTRIYTGVYKLNRHTEETHGREQGN